LVHLLWLKRLLEEITGNVFENSVFSEPAKNISPENIYYWRTQDKKEIDFIIEEKHGLVPLEVKLNAAALNYTALKYFSSQYECRQAFCISLEGILPVGKMEVENIKPWEYPLYREVLLKNRKSGKSRREEAKKRRREEKTWNDE